MELQKPNSEKVKMDRIPYENIGNLGKDYEHEPRIVVTEGLIAGKNLVLKLYSMLKPNNIPGTDIKPAVEFVKAEMKKDRIKPYIGMGFAILSEDVLNIARWNNEHPIVLMNDVYSYERGDIANARADDIRESGSFCTWELEIVGHERNSWINFLTSNKSQEQKNRYLNDFTGKLKYKPIARKAP